MEEEQSFQIGTRFAFPRATPFFSFSLFSFLAYPPPLTLWVRGGEGVNYRRLAPFSPFAPAFICTEREGIQTGRGRKGNKER